MPAPDSASKQSPEAIIIIISLIICNSRKKKLNHL
jgi:hypothetical protein